MSWHTYPCVCKYTQHENEREIWQDWSFGVCMMMQISSWAILGNLGRLWSLLQTFPLCLQICAAFLFPHLPAVCSLVLFSVLMYLSFTKMCHSTNKNLPDICSAVSRLSAPASEVSRLGGCGIHSRSGFLLRGHPNHLLCHFCLHPVPWYTCG